MVRPGWQTLLISEPSLITIFKKQSPSVRRAVANETGPMPGISQSSSASVSPV